MSVKIDKSTASESAPNGLPCLGDLFSGAGGFSLGAHLAGFKTAFAVDFDKDLTHSFTTNFPKTKLLLKDLGKTEPAEILAEAGVLPRELTGVIGGPPCQGFSVMGHRKADDPRNSLLGTFFDFVLYADPAFFIMENVPNIMSKQYEDILASGLAKVAESYQIIGPLLVDATRYGAATKRVRTIVIGFDLTRVNPITESDIRAIETDALTTVYHAIHDLPDPTEDDEAKGWSSYRSKPARGCAGDYARRARAYPPAGMGGGALPSLIGKKVSGLQNTVHSETIIQRIQQLKPGAVDPVSKAKKLSWDAACTVLRAGTGKEKGSHQAVRPIHPDKPRVITVREAARIQGFPDWFQFHETKWHSFRMIGNSVSPYVSEKILSLIKSRLK